MRRKVLYLHASTILGGTELRSFQIASRLKDTFELAVLFHCPRGAICDYYRRENIPYMVTPFPRLGAALGVIRQFKPDIVHIFGLKTNVLWRPILSAMGYHHLIGHIAGLTNEGEKPSWLRVKIDLWTSRFLKVYLANSQRVADQLAQYGFQPGKLRVIHNGVIVPATLPVTSPHTPPVILSVGNLRPVKGQRYLIDALKQLHDRGIAFKAWIVGVGPDQSMLQTLIREYRLEDSVQLLGELDNPALLTLMENADVFALLSLSEGISGAAMEAMAHGLPVVVSNVGGMSELVSQGVEGYLVPARTATEAADRLAELIAQPVLRSTLREKAYAKIKSQFNLDDTIRHYEKLYLNDAFSS